MKFDAKLLIRFYPKVVSKTSHIFFGNKYMPAFSFDDSGSMYSGRLEFKGREHVYPGEAVEASVIFMRLDLVKDFLLIGKKFKLNECSILIGEGEIIDI